jgi:Lamin Tail Domain
VRVTSVNVAAQDSTIALQNAGTQPVNVSNWSVQVGSARATLPSGVNVQPGQSVMLHTTAGTSTQSDVFLGQDAQAITTQLRPGVEVVVNNPAGSPVTSFVVPNG